MTTDQVEVRVVARTPPGRQEDVGRALRARILTALRGAGVMAPVDRQPAAASAGRGG